MFVMRLVDLQMPMRFFSLLLLGMCACVAFVVMWLSLVCL